MNKKWYVSLGDGTYVKMDERPYVFLATDEQIDILDAFFEGRVVDCTDDGLQENLSIRGTPQRLFETHIHIEDLVEHSHWNENWAEKMIDHTGHYPIVPAEAIPDL